MRIPGTSPTIGKKEDDQYETASKDVEQERTRVEDGGNGKYTETDCTNGDVNGQRLQCLPRHRLQCLPRHRKKVRKRSKDDDDVLWAFVNRTLAPCHPKVLKSTLPSPPAPKTASNSSSFVRCSSRALSSVRTTTVSSGPVVVDLLSVFDDKLLAREAFIGRREARAGGGGSP
jgi:hypothetical protein